MKPTALTRWTSENSAELYSIRNWGADYFDISPEGNVLVRPYGSQHSVAIDLLELISELRDQDLSTPVLLRFSDILRTQIRYLNESFANAIREAEYGGSYRGVYPIKVNQKQQVVADIMEFGAPYHHGLEAGSKAELIAAVAAVSDPEALVICNGYKDEEFIDLALKALKLGLQVIIVIEMLSEIDLILERAAALGVAPRLGVRLKLSARGGGRWMGSAGDRSKFGLNAGQVIMLTDRLRKAGKLDCLQMLHYHLGSQIPDIRRVRTALREACRFYVDLVGEGAPMGMLNVGGGLAVDYDGSRTNFASSRNYSTREYAADVVEIVLEECNAAGIAHPTIVSESGRATVAHHSILIFNILESRQFECGPVPDELPDDASEMLKNLVEVQESLSARKAQEAYHDALYYRDEIRAMFLHGDVSLRERAVAENIFWHVIRRIADVVQTRKYVPDEMEGLEAAIADVYYGNFSLFQSLPDSWALEQLFPVMPIHRLNELPARQAVLADITCDSDGKIDRFIDLHDTKRVLPVHELNHEEYYLGIFLVGAYQETLGDMHNLLGDTNVLHVRTDESGETRFVQEVAGDSVEQVLSYVEYQPADLVEGIRERVAAAAKEGLIDEDQRRDICQAFEDGMKGYTYFEK